MTFGEWATQAFDPVHTNPAAHSFRVAHGAVLAVGLAAIIAGTDPSIEAEHLRVLEIIACGALGFFTVEYLARLALAPSYDSMTAHLTPARTRLRWCLSFSGLCDLAGVLPFLTALASGASFAHASLFGMLWIFKLTRHAPRLGLLGRVLRQARAPVLSVFSGFLIVLFGSATLAYLIEGPVQPDHFGSIPKALYWAITTLTTTGYGDGVPVTPAGRLVAGVIMVCGILLFALWAGILATEFGQEMRRQQFLQTWNLVSKVPYFQNVEPGLIAEVARLLRPRQVAAGTVVVRRGEPGDCMYFIAEGEVEIQVQPRPVRLGTGSFFGEIALITGGMLTATVIATERTMLLSLDIVDFRELAARRPDLTKAIDEEASRRVAESAIPGGI